MIQDRGKVKWNSAAFLLEHTESLREFFKEYNHKKKPELTEEQIAEMNNLILESMEYNSTLNITYFKLHDFHLVTGNIHYADQLKQELRIVDLHNSLHIVKFDELVDVRLN
jgi:hypothetical protein